VEKPNEKMVSDITYLWTDEGWLYIAGIMDFITSLVCLFYWGKGIKKRRRVISQIKGITGWRTKSGRNKTNDRPNAKFHWLS
jgi:transposase InsO family protein